MFKTKQLVFNNDSIGVNDSIGIITQDIYEVIHVQLMNEHSKCLAYAELNPKQIMLN